MSYKGRKTRPPAKDGGSEDAFFARKWYNWNPGVVKWIQRQSHKRARRQAKKEIRNED